MRPIAAIATLAFLIPAGCGGAGGTPATGTPPNRDPSTPPIAARIAHPVTQHGETRQDDYYWLREKNGTALRYLKDENEHTRHVLKPTEALREKLFAEIRARVRQTDVDVPVLDRGYYYYERTVEGAQYPLHCRRRGRLDAPKRSCSI